MLSRQMNRYVWSSGERSELERYYIFRVTGSVKLVARAANQQGWNSYMFPFYPSCLPKTLGYNTVSRLWYKRGTYIDRHGLEEKAERQNVPIYHDGMIAYTFFFCIFI